MKRLKTIVFFSVVPVLSLAGLVLLCTGFVAIQTNWSTSSMAEVDQAHEQSKIFYATKKTYSVDISYSSYKGHDAIVPYETMTGYYRYDNGKSHTYFQGMHTVVNGAYKVILDSAHKTMVITDASIASSAELMQINYENSKQYVTSCKKASSQVSTDYRIEFDEHVAYSTYELSFRKDGQLKDIIVYYRQEYPSDPKQPNSPKVKPKLKVSYGPVVEKVQFTAKEFDLTKYFTESKGVLKAAPAYSSYQLVDSRSSRKR